MVVLIVLIAALVIIRYTEAKEKAYVAQMQNDLRNFVMAEELHLHEMGAYVDTTTPFVQPASTTLIACSPIQ